MADTNKGGGKMKSPLGGRKIKFNLYWIYALVLIVLMFIPDIWLISLIIRSLQRSI